MRYLLLVLIFISVLSVSYTLRIQTVPSRVDVYSNGILVGNTGRSGEIVLDVEGRTTLTFVKPGYWSKTTELVVSTSTTLRVELPALVRGCIETSPPGALLFVDGVEIGMSPYSGDLPKGLHRVKAVKPGYGELESSVEIDDNSHIKLKLIEYGTVKFVSEIPCTVAVDSKYLGTPPATAVLQPGTHTVLIKTEWGVIAQEFRIEPEETLKVLNLPLDMCCVEISTNPDGAWVVIDGWIGKTPVFICRKPGIYDVRVFKKGYRPLKKRLNLSKKFDAIALDLKRAGYPVEIRSDIGAEVYLNGVPVGKTPLKIEVPEGFSEIVLVSGDRIWYEKILGGYDTEVEASLTKKATLIFQDDLNREYRLEGIAIFPGSVLHIDPGVYELEVNPGENIALKYQLDLKAGELLLVSRKGMEKISVQRIIERR